MDRKFEIALTEQDGYLTLKSTKIDTDSQTYKNPTELLKMISRERLKLKAVDTVSVAGMFGSATTIFGACMSTANNSEVPLKFGIMAGALAVGYAAYRFRSAFAVNRQRIEAINNEVSNYDLRLVQKKNINTSSSLNSTPTPEATT